MATAVGTKNLSFDSWMLAASMAAEATAATARAKRRASKLTLLTRGVPDQQQQQQQQQPNPKRKVKRERMKAKEKERKEKREATGSGDSKGSGTATARVACVVELPFASPLSSLRSGSQGSLTRRVLAN